VKAETLVDTLPATLSEMDVETIGDTLGDVEIRIVVKPLACNLEVVAEALGYAALLARRCWRPRNFKTHRAVYRRKKYRTC